MKASLLIVAAAGIALGAVAQAQSPFILIPDSSADVIVKLSAVDGSVIDASFIVDANDPLTYDFSTPKDVLQVEDEIWVIDQVQDGVFRFDMDGNWIGTTIKAAAMADNVRGGAYANGVVYVTSDGTANGAPGDAVVMYDTSGNHMGFFSAANTGTSPFDVTEYNGELLVCHFTSTNDIGRYDYAGNLQGIFHSSNGVTGIDLPEHMIVSAAGTLLVTGFGAPIGIYEYDMTGAQINVFPHTSGLRGVAELSNGLLLISDGTGIKTYDKSNGATVTILATTGGQFPGVFDFGGDPMTYCTAKVTSNGCVPAIGFTGTPSPSGAFHVTCDQVEVNEMGLAVYSLSGPAATPFFGGTLCLQSPNVFRTPSQGSGGLLDCTGAYAHDMTSVIASQPSGTTIWTQFWFRDSGDPAGVGLSDALEFTTNP